MDKEVVDNISSALGVSVGISIHIYIQIFMFSHLFLAVKYYNSLHISILIQALGLGEIYVEHF